MARKGVAILREIAMVNASGVATEVKIKMLKELNDELALLYAPEPSKQQDLKLPQQDSGSEKKK